MSTLGRLDPVMQSAREIAEILQDGGGLSGYGKDAPAVVELCELAVLLEFRMQEAESERDRLLRLLKSGLTTEDGETVVELTIQADGDPSVGIPHHEWLEPVAGFEVIAIESNGFQKERGS